MKSVFGDRLLVEEMETEETTDSGIVIKATTSKDVVECKVVAIGTSVFETMDIGDIVLISKGCGTNIGSDLFVVELSDVLGVK